MRFGTLFFALALCSISLAAPTTQPVHTGQDISARIASAQPDTTFLLDPHAAVTCHSTVLVIAPGVTIDGGSTGTLEASPSKGNHTVFDIKAANFTFKNFAKIAATEDDTANTELFRIEAPYATISHNTTVEGLLKFVETAKGGDYCRIDTNHIGKTGSLPVFGVTSHCIVCFNTFDGSYGEYALRWVADSDNRGFPIYDKAGCLVRATDLKVYGNIIVDHNSLGKQAVGFRAVDGVDCYGNIIDGSIRIGEPAPAGSLLVAQSRCLNCAIHNNTFRNAFGAPSTAWVPAIAVMGGSTGRISANTFQSTATHISPIAIASGNQIIIGADNVQQASPGQALKPLVAPTSDARSFTLEAAPKPPKPTTQPKK